jgi:B9 domain-containing protein 2
MGNYPRLTTLSPLTTEQGDFARRHIINSISNGKVMLELEVLMKNFRNLGMSGQGK